MCWIDVSTKKEKKRKKTELTNCTSITQVDITMKNDESKHTNGTLIKLLLKRTPPPKKKNKLVSTLHVQPPGNTTCISSGHFPLSLIPNVQFSGGSRGGVRGACPPPLSIDQTEAWRAEKNFLPTYLKVGIRQTECNIYFLENDENN